MTSTVDDELAIQRVLTRYCRGVDRGDKELLRSVYHPDAIDEHGELFSGLGVEFADFIVDYYAKAVDATMHYVVNSLVDIAGDDARGETYFLVAHRLTVDGRQVVELAGGRYVDRFARRDGEWRVAHRRCVADWDVRLEGAAAFPPGVFPVGSRTHSDPSYQNGPGQDC